MALMCTSETGSLDRNGVFCCNLGPVSSTQLSLEILLAWGHDQTKTGLSLSLHLTLSSCCVCLSLSRAVSLHPRPNAVVGNNYQAVAVGRSLRSDTILHTLIWLSIYDSYEGRRMQLGVEDEGSGGQSEEGERKREDTS